MKSEIDALSEVGRAFILRFFFVTAGLCGQIRGETIVSRVQLHAVRLSPSSMHFWFCIMCGSCMSCHQLLAHNKPVSHRANVCRRDLLDISPLVQDAAAAIVDDSFLRCFQSQSTDPWNWNIYLFPLWAVGMVVRYLILFPLR